MHLYPYTVYMSRLHSIDLGRENCKMGFKKVEFRSRQHISLSFNKLILLQETLAKPQIIKMHTMSQVFR